MRWGVLELVLSLGLLFDVGYGRGDVEVVQHEVGAFKQRLFGLDRVLLVDRTVVQLLFSGGFGFWEFTLKRGLYISKSLSHNFSSIGILENRFLFGRTLHFNDLATLLGVPHINNNNKESRNFQLQKPINPSLTHHASTIHLYICLLFSFNRLEQAR